MKHIEKKKSLVLKTQTVRALQGAELTTVAGGLSLFLTVCAPCHTYVGCEMLPQE